jgi:hypothetical protein
MKIIQNKMVSSYDETHGSNGIDPTQVIHVDLVDSQVHTCAEILQVDKQCSIIHDLFYDMVHTHDTLHSYI